MTKTSSALTAVLDKTISENSYLLQTCSSLYTIILKSTVTINICHHLYTGYFQLYT